MHQLVDLFALPETTLYANVVEVSGVVNLWLVPLVHTLYVNYFSIYLCFK
jgi:hypothetical protein